MEFVIITGLSGAGKSRAAEFLEDVGFYTVDNIPPEFMPKFAEFCMHANGRYDRVALVSDVRAGDSFEPLLKALDDLKEMGCNYQLLFMEADLPTIIKRYKGPAACTLCPGRGSRWRTRPTGSGRCSARCGTEPPMCWTPPPSLPPICSVQRWKSCSTWGRSRAACPST